MTPFEQLARLKAQAAKIAAKIAKLEKSIKESGKQFTKTDEGGVGIPEIKAALAFLEITGSVAAARQAIAVAEQIKKIV
jgi:hypothetical protein